jgi:retron-type reverse transcriptase
MAAHFWQVLNDKHHIKETKLSQKMETLTVIGNKEHLQDWSQIDWKSAMKNVRNLRKRIYRATQNRQWNKVRSLTKLMLRSFDNINHETILKSMGNFPARNLIKQWLKAGYLDKGRIHDTKNGTPQGGIISPLLANIGLHGLEDFLSQFKKVKGKYKSDRYGFVRYADDFIITATSREDIEAVQPIIEQWLSSKGLQLNREKTQIVHISEGFNFLGFNLKQYKGKLLIKPQKEKDGLLIDTLKLEAKDGNLFVRSKTVEVKLKKLAYST